MPLTNSSVKNTLIYKPENERFGDRIFEKFQKIFSLPQSHYNMRDSRAQGCPAQTAPSHKKRGFRGTR